MMKSRNKLIIGLIIAAVLLAAVQGVIIPRIVQNNKQDISNQQNPLTHDFARISKYKSSYMGDASNLTGLFYQLPLSDVDMSFKLVPETFTAEVNYKASTSDISDDMLDMALIYNATAAFALIDNLEAVRFNFDGSSFKILRSDVEEWYGVDLQALAEETAWKDKVQGRLNDEGYIQSCLKEIVIQEERTSIAEAIADFYDNTDQPVIIYEQVPFEDGTLVLAEKLTDGEHYPDLHFIDSGNKVSYLTRGSYCWTLNYTRFKGHYIYFGLAGTETRRYKYDSIPVEKVEALFSDKTVNAVPEKEILSHINTLEKDTRLFKNPQGYIMPVEGREIPYDFAVVLENGEKLSLSKKVIESSIDYMPDYLKSKRTEVYNSFAFTFTPMLSPIEWNKGYKEGEICLEGKTDNNGNRNACYLMPAGHMSLADSFILPQDIKPLYLSDSHPRTANFSAGETVTVKYPEKRKLLDCRILSLTGEKVEKEIGQDRLDVIGTNEKGQLILPEAKGHYLFLLRTIEAEEIQTYTGMLIIQ